jgi:hypothetical protein
VTRSDREAARNLELALGMMELGLKMKRAQLRRSKPRASEAKLDDLLDQWLADRPLTVPGRRVAWPRSSRSFAAPRKTSKRRG